MKPRSAIVRAVRVVATGAAVAAGAYAVCVGLAWSRYGEPPAPSAEEADELLDRFIPMYDVVERHRVRIAAPAALVLAAAKEQDLREPLVIRAIFRAREIALGGETVEDRGPVGLLAEVQSLGWGILASRADREIVVGAVTKPWEATVTFHPLGPDRFAGFAEPHHVKIAWTLRADPAGDNDTIFRTETRAVATDETARAKFRRYWAFASPGVASIRWLSLRSLKRAAERRAAAAWQVERAQS